MILVSSNAYSCSCFEISADEPFVIFKVISGHAIKKPLRDPKELDLDYLHTMVEVIDPGTSKRKIGDVFKLTQRRTMCAKYFYPPFKYSLHSDLGRKEETSSSCGIKIKKFEGMEEAYEDWLAKIVSELEKETK